MPEYNLYSNLFKKKCCPPKPLKKNIYNPEVLSKFPINMRISHQIVASVGTGNQCYTVADKQLNAYGKWAGCPGGSGPGYSSTMRYMPYENSSGLGPNIGGSICNCTYLGSAIYPPVNTVSPVITGNTEAGSTLTCSSGTWTGTPTPTLSYQWYSGVTQISGQTTNSYVTQPADIGQSITCQVTGSNAGGSIVVTSNIITPTPTIVAPVNLVAPVITGNTEVGSTLTCSSGTWTGTPTPTLSYQWYRGGVTQISGQTNTTYVTQPADIGQAITCQVTGTNVGGSTVVISNNIITPTPPTPSLLLDTNNFYELIGPDGTYYLAQGQTLYVMPAGSYMTSFTVEIQGTNIVIDFQNESNTSLFTWSDNQSRIATVPTTVTLATAVNISGCSRCMFTNLFALMASFTPLGVKLLGIRIYGYTI
jgi:hypothetical protein